MKLQTTENNSALWPFVNSFNWGKKNMQWQHSKWNTTQLLNPARFDQTRGWILRRIFYDPFVISKLDRFPGRSTGGFGINGEKLTSWQQIVFSSSVISINIHAFVLKRSFRFSNLKKTKKKHFCKDSNKGVSRPLAWLSLCCKILIQSLFY